MRVILAATNEQLGVMRLDEAIRRARALGLDLVEIAPNAQPPVCRIVDFGKFRYDLSKQEKEKKHSVSKVKEVKFRVNIDEHDYLTKIRHAEDFLDKGNKVKIHLQFRGREMAHKELGMDVVQRVRTDLNGMAAHLPHTTLARVFLWFFVVFLVLLSGKCVCVVFFFFF